MRLVSKISPLSIMQRSQKYSLQYSSGNNPQQVKTVVRLWMGQSGIMIECFSNFRAQTINDMFISPTAAISNESITSSTFTDSDDIKDVCEDENITCVFLHNVCG